MITCNLERILKKYNYSINSFSDLSGISRATLSALAQNTGKGVQFDTLDTICTKLSIPIEELFTHCNIESYTYFHLVDNLYNMYEDPAIDGGYYEYIDKVQLSGFIEFSGPNILDNYNKPIIEGFGTLTNPLTYEVFLEITEPTLYTYQLCTMGLPEEIREHLFKEIKLAVKAEFIDRVHLSDMENIKVIVNLGESFYTSLPTGLNANTFRDLYRELIELKKEVSELKK